MKWSPKMVTFDQAFEDQTSGQVKIQRGDYLPGGLLPVIDQGQKPIAGYSDNPDHAYQGPLPVILFGDHTLSLKHVNFSFALGADGVRVLASRPPFLSKFLYYYLTSLNIKSHGYSRHFKYLREIKFPQIAESEQIRIVELLEQADRLRQQRAEADQMADRILPALFHKMFGDPATNPKGWPRRRFGEMLARIDSGWSPVCENRVAASDEWGILKLSAVTTNRFLEFENKALPAALAFDPDLEVRAGDLLFTRKNTRELVGACAYVETTRSKLMLSDLIFRFRLKPDAEVHPLYLWALLIYPTKRQSIQLLAGGSSGSMPNISKGRLETLEIEMPPLQLQTAFADAVVDYNQLCQKAATARDQLEKVFSTMLHRAFTGELTANWREAHLKELLAEMEHQARMLRSPNKTNLN